MIVILSYHDDGSSKPKLTFLEDITDVNLSIYRIAQTLLSVLEQGKKVEVYQYADYALETPSLPR